MTTATTPIATDDVHYLRHLAHCSTTHRSFKSLARCIWRNSEVAGDGQYAVVVAAGHRRLVTLWAFADAALDTLNDLNAAADDLPPAYRPRVIRLSLPEPDAGEQVQEVVDEAAWDVADESAGYLPDERSAS